MDETTRGVGRPPKEPGKKFVQRVIHLHPDTDRAVREIAEREDLPVSAVVRRFVRLGLEAAGEKAA